MEKKPPVDGESKHDRKGNKFLQGEGSFFRADLWFWDQIKFTYLVYTRHFHGNEPVDNAYAGLDQDYTAPNFLPH